MSTSKKQRGRPVGSVQTPRTILKQDMREAARLNREMRELLTAQLKEIKKELAKPEIELTVRLAVIEALTASLAGGARTMDATAKHIIDTEDTEEEAVDFLKELRG